MGSVQENVTVKIREDGSRVVSRNISGIGDAADKSAGRVSNLSGLLAGLVTGAALFKIASLADEFTNLQNRLRLVTTDSTNLARITKELGNISNSTRSSFTATADLYARMAQAAKGLGLSQRDTLNFTKSLNQAVILSGASAEEAAGGIRQLSQGIAKGTLNGDELTGVLEGLPAVADVIAKGFGVTRGELKKLGEEGKLSAEGIIDAFKKAQGELDKGFATTVPTLGQSITVLKNNFILFIGELDKAYGITSSLASAILTLSQNLNTIIPIITAVGVSIALSFVPSLIAKFTTEIRALWALMMANPFVAVAAVVAGLVAYLVLMRNEIKLGIDETTTLGDLMTAAWEDVSAGVVSAWDAVSDFFDRTSRGAADMADKTAADTARSGGAQEASWLKVLRTAAKVFDMIGATVRGVMRGIQNVVILVIASLMNHFNQLGKAMDAALNLDVDGIKAAATNAQAGYKKVGSDLGKVFNEGLEQEVLSQGRGGMEAKLDQWIARAQEIGKGRGVGQPEGALAGAGARGPKPVDSDKDGAKKAARELAQLKDALQGVRDEADPLGAATRHLAEAQDVLTRSVKAGLITQEESVKIYEQLKFQMRDQLDPLAALNRAIDENMSLLKLSNDERKIEGDLLHMTQQLQRDGVMLTKEQTDALRAKLVVEQELDRIANVRDQLQQGGTGKKNQEFEDQLKAMKELMADPKSGFTGMDSFNVINAMFGGTLDETQAGLEARQEQMAVYFQQLDALRQADLLSEEAVSQAKRAMWVEEQQKRLAATSSALGSIALLQQTNSKKAFEVGRAAAMGQAIVNTYSAAIAAYQSAAAIPYVGWILGPAAAAGAIAAGMAQVSAIRSQQMPAFRTGGEFMVGGSGGTDSQNVNLRATPGERISIHTPAQARALERLGEENDTTPRGTPKVSQTVNLIVSGKMDGETQFQAARAIRRESTRELVRTRK